MNKKIIPYFILPSVLIFIGLGTLPSILRTETPSVTSMPRNDKESYSEKINLALRQTAHKLLILSGDSTSTIAPVKKTADNVYLVKLERHFNYDSLPSFLQNSFNAFDIEGKYDVAVLDCQNQELVLGYRSINLSKESEAACTGRNQGLNCYNFTVTFTELPSNSAQSPWVWFLLGGLIASSIGAIAYFFYFNSKKKEVIAPLIIENSIDATHLICIGKTIFDTRNQTISIDNILQKLTFRESKLLQLFCHHQNELIDRDVILKAVWEDEGVLVGRSVDVFVSRLRKVLKNDAALKITNVHSRGYRFETIVE